MSDHLENALQTGVTLIKHELLLCVTVLTISELNLFATHLIYNVNITFYSKHLCLLFHYFYYIFGLINNIIFSHLLLYDNKTQFDSIIIFKSISCCQIISCDYKIVFSLSFLMVFIGFTLVMSTIHVTFLLW